MQLLKLLLVALVACPTAATASHELSKDKWLLPPYAKPEHYWLTIQPLLKPTDNANVELAYYGNVTIRIKCASSTDRFVIHRHKDLSFQERNVKVHSRNGPIYVYGMKYNEETEKLEIRLRRNMTAGQHYNISITNFYRNLHKTRGFYYCTYTGPSNETRYVASTHIGNVRARWIFPCFDEPRYKANFSITLVRRKEFKTSLANMDKIASVSGTGHYSGFVVDSFRTSPRMSTYLVAFAVCDFDNPLTTDANGVKISAYSRNSINKHAEYALKLAKKSLRYFEDYFGAKYPLPKLDMLGLPYLLPGGMENWGLMTFREKNLLFDQEKDSLSDRIELASILVHELIHQWFGDLVTMKWWDDIWLNEAFAQLMEKELAYIEPELAEPVENSMFEAQFVAMRMDTVKTHPIRKIAYNPKSGINHLLAYYKGNALVYMLEKTLTSEVFRKGIQIYMRRHKFSNTDTNDLARALEEAATHAKSTNSSLRRRLRNMHVQDFVTKWVTFEGLPVVKLIRCGGRVIAVQKRFTLLQNASSNTWPIPISFATGIWSIRREGFKILPGSERKFLYFFLFSAGGESTTIAGNLRNNEWLLANLGHTAFIRVDYDAATWRVLARLLQWNHQVVPRISRATLMDDSFYLTWTGDRPIATFMDISKYFKNEKALLPRTVAYGVFRRISGLVQGTEAECLFKKYAEYLLSPGLSEQNYESEDDPARRELQSQILTESCFHNIEAATAIARGYFNRWKSANGREDAIPPHLFDSVICCALRTGTENDWEFVYGKFVKSTAINHKRTLRDTLLCTRNSSLVDSFLDKMLQDVDVKLYDIYSIMKDLIANPAVSRQVWKFMKKNYAELHEAINMDYFFTIMGTIPHDIYEEMKSLRPQISAGHIGKYDSLMDNIRAAHNWKQMHAGNLRTWLLKNGATCCCHVQQLRNVLLLCQTYSYFCYTCCV